MSVASNGLSSLSNWDEYTRRQYEAKAPKLNPYGSDEAPKHFRDFDIFLKIRVLHQLTIWTFWNPDRMRERMPDHNNEARMIEWVRFLPAYRPERTNTCLNSGSRNLVGTARTARTTYSMTIASTVEPNLPYLLYLRLNQRPPHKRRKQQNVERAKEQE